MMMRAHTAAMMLLLAVLAACGTGNDASGESKRPEMVVKLPAYLPLYPGAEVHSSTEQMLPGKHQSVTTFETTDQPEQVISFYATHLMSGGFKMMSEANEAAMRGVSARRSSDGDAVDIVAELANKGTRVRVTATEDMADETQKKGQP